MNDAAVSRVPAPELITAFDPSTREALGTIPVDGPEAVREAVRRARRAQVAWAKTDFATRRRVLHRIRDHILDHMDPLADLVARDAGKTRENALMGELWPVLEKLRWTAAKGERHLRAEAVSSGLFVHKRARLEYHPRGVVGAIIPWNYPFQNIMNPVIPGLFAGNAVVVKPSEWVAWSARKIIQIVRDALEAEGHSPDLVSVVQGYADTGRALIHGGIDSLVFIGSVANGHRILEAAAKTITPVVLELGGKDPFIVCDDASLDQAAHAAMAGCFISAGQNCVAAERMLVFDQVYEAFEEKVGALVRGLRQGPPRDGAVVDVGAMTTPLQLDIVEGLVKRAVEQGARVVAGGERVFADTGNYFAPTVLADVTPDMDIMKEETFGPVMLLCRVHDEREAIEVANGTAFGLSSSVFSRDHARANRIARELKAGMTAINEFGGMTYMAQDLTFGGVAYSGFGKMNGRDGLRSFCVQKSVLDDRLPLHFATKLFPVGERDFDRIKGAVQLVYGGGLRRKLRGVRDLAKTLRG